MMLILFFALSSAFAGGQEGNGGNSCWLRHERRAVSFEEVLYPEMRQENHVRRFELPAGAERISLQPEQPMFRIVAEKFQRVRRDHRLLGSVLLDAINLYRDVFVLKTQPIDGFYEGSFFAARECRALDGYPRPAILTFSNGGIVFFKSSLQKMSPTSQQILLIHEALRFLQMFHPALALMTNFEIERLASRIYEGKKIQENELFTNIEATLKVFVAQSGQSSQPSEALANTVKVTVQEYLARGETMSAALNHLRIENASFRKELAKEMDIIFVNWRQR